RRPRFPHRPGHRALPGRAPAGGLRSMRGRTRPPAQRRGRPSRLRVVSHGTPPPPTEPPSELMLPKDLPSSLRDGLALAEVVLEVVLAALSGVEAPRIADVGTGSGCVAVALARELPRARVMATDVSEAALELALANAREHGFEDRIAFAAGSLVEPLRPAGP